jgi:hypothetical protein
MVAVILYHVLFPPSCPQFSGFPTLMPAVVARHLVQVAQARHTFPTGLGLVVMLVDFCLIRSWQVWPRLCLSPVTPANVHDRDDGGADDDQTTDDTTHNGPNGYHTVVAGG